jgi:hypothetical protein
MRTRFLLPLLLALAACGGSDDFDSDTIQSVEAPTLSSEAKLQGILTVANELTHDELLSDAHLEPTLADAIVAARAEGVHFTSPDQIEELFTRSLDTTVNPLCSYYTGMTQYYAIRALQCAYSVCYPMTPWYGFMAEYYGKLADMYCLN